MEGLKDILKRHPFFAGLDEDFLTLVGGCSENVKFDPGAALCREGEDAERFYVIRHGRVSLEINVPGRGPVTFQTVGEGEIVGVSWLVPPYRWSYDARAVTLTRAVAIHTRCLIDKCEANHDLGYELMKRFMPVLVERLRTTRLQILDVYGNQA